MVCARWGWACSLHPPLSNMAAPRVTLFANQDKRPEILALAKTIRNLANTRQRQAVLVGDVAQIIVAGFCATGTIPQKQIGHLKPSFPRQKAALPAAAACLPARMGGGGKAESLPWRGPAGEARHSGAAILLWEREGKALGVPTQSGKRSRQALGSKGTEPIGSRLHKNGTRRFPQQKRHPCTARRRRTPCGGKPVTTGRCVKRSPGKGTRRRPITGG